MAGRPSTAAPSSSPLALSATRLAARLARLVESGEGDAVEQALELLAALPEPRLVCQKLLRGVDAHVPFDDDPAQNTLRLAAIATAPAAARLRQGLRPAAFSELHLRGAAGPWPGNGLPQAAPSRRQPRRWGQDPIRAVRPVLPPSVPILRLPSSGLERFTGLTRLSLVDCPLPDDLAARWLPALPALTRLDLWNTGLRALPAGLGGLPKLTALDVRENQLTDLPEALWVHGGLRSLVLNHNRLARLPARPQLPALRVLEMSANRLEALPEQLDGLGALGAWKLASNQLEGLPAELGPLRSLQRLDLRHNQLQTLPASLAQLPLRVLELAHNQLRAVPDLAAARQLEELDLEDNPALQQDALLAALQRSHWVQTVHRLGEEAVRRPANGRPGPLTLHL